jgi:hypothetical protein
LIFAKKVVGTATRVLLALTCTYHYNSHTTVQKTNEGRNQYPHIHSVHHLYITTSMSLMPMAVFGLEVPAGDVAIPARADIPSAFHITMAAIDPSATPEGDEGAPVRATLKIIRQPLIYDDSEDDEDDENDFDPAEMERMLAEESSDDDEDDEEDAAGGPSDPTKTKAARKAAAREAIKKLLEGDDGMDVDETKSNGIKSAKARGKMPASDEDDDDEDDDEDDSDLEDMEGGEIEEFVICTLDAEKVCPKHSTTCFTLPLTDLAELPANSQPDCWLR